MAKAYIQSTNITTDAKVIVQGQLSSTNVKVSLEPRIYVAPPVDGIYEYDLVVTASSGYGLTVLLPFQCEAVWTGDKNAKGMRIIQSGAELESTLLLKGSRVEKSTKTTQNPLEILGVHYDDSDDQLVFEVSYSGGCFEHAIDLEWEGPGFSYLNLVDVSKADPCEAIIKVQLRYDISTPDFQIKRPAEMTIRTPESRRAWPITLT